jgi:hypothetical protein
VLFCVITSVDMYIWYLYCYLKILVLQTSVPMNLTWEC